MRRPFRSVPVPSRVYVRSAGARIQFQPARLGYIDLAIAFLIDFAIDFLFDFAINFLFDFEIDSLFDLVIDF